LCHKSINEQENILEGPDHGIRTNELRECQPIEIMWSSTFVMKHQNSPKWETFAFTLYKWQTHCLLVYFNRHVL